MNGLSGLELLNGVGDELVASCAETKKRSSPVKYLLPIAAGFALVLAAALIIPKLPGKAPNGEQHAAVPPVTDAPVTNAPVETPDSRPVPLRNDPDPFLDMSAYEYSDNTVGFNEDLLGENFFVYRGKVYRYYMHFNRIYPENMFELIGPKAADIARNPLIPEYPEGGMMVDEDGLTVEGRHYTAYEILQELTGTFDGPVYELRGYDPEYVLCRPTGGGELQLYFTGSGAVTGADILESRFHLRERMAELVCEYGGRGLAGSNMPRSLDTVAYGDAIGRFLDALYQAEWEANTYGNQDVKTVCYLHFFLADGMRIELTVLDNGKVYFPEGTSPAQLRVDPEALAELTELILADTGEPTLLPERDLNSQFAVCRSLPGAGSVVPDLIPSGFEIISIDAEFTHDEDLIPGGVSRLNVLFKSVNSGKWFGFNVMTQEYFDSVQWTAIESVVPAGEFSAEDFSRSVLEKDGSEYWIGGAVSLDGYVIMTTANYIIDGNSGSHEELQSLLESMAELLQAVGG